MRKYTNRFLFVCQVYGFYKTLCVCSRVLDRLFDVCCFEYCDSVLLTGLHLRIDISEHRLGIAKQMGADFTITINPSNDARATAESIVELIGGPPDVTIECSGAQSSLQTGIYVIIAVTYDFHCFRMS